MVSMQYLLDTGREHSSAIKFYYGANEKRFSVSWYVVDSVCCKSLTVSLF